VIYFNGEAAGSDAMNDLKAWLERLGLGQHVQVLTENDVDLDVLPHLSDDDLKDLGLSLGHRRKLVAALSDEATVAETAAQPDPAPPYTDPETEGDAERRQLTVMFCDLVESTELSQKLDPEELREVLRCYHDTVARIITGHQGHVAKLLGDGVLAYFGWPHAYEDQAAQAIHAALAAAVAVGGIEGAGEPLAARAGIATGQVVIGDMMGGAVQERGAVAGETPNLAARLQGLARPGEVVINDATRRLTRGSFVLEEGGGHRLKGFAEPVAVWRVTDTARTGSRVESTHEAELTEFIGRSHEIGLLLDRWDRARNGEGQVVLISGEAGIGKSRILREFITRLGFQDHRMLRYQCSTHEVNAAFNPVITEIETTAGFQPDDTVAALRDKLDSHLATAFGDPGEAAPLIATLLSLPLDGNPLLDMAPQRRKQRTVAALVERIAMLSRQQPVVMMIEDIHWIDASSLEMLDALVERVRDLPVLVVMAYRPEFVPQWGGHGHVTLHSLNRLGRSDGRAIAERITGGKALPGEVLNRILEQTDGIPLFVEELTKTVLEAGFLEEQEDRYVLNGPLPAMAIPATLHDSLMARLDRMAPVKRVIQAAACIGREFSAELLAAALPMGASKLEDALGQLLEAQLIFRRGGAESTNYIFKHALVQDAAYASLLVATRRSLHQQLALALEQTDDPDPLALARHFSVAGANERASRLYLAAGRQSLGASALPEAIGALELGLREVEAIAASTGRDRLELDLRVALGTARMANFGWAHPSVSGAMEPAFALAKAFGDRDALGSILWGLWVHYQTRTDFPRAHEWLDELETVARENPGSDLTLVHDMSAGCQFFWEADYPRALGRTDHLRTIYDPGKHSRITTLTNHDPLVFSQHWAGSLTEWIAGNPERSVERLDEAVSLARKVGHPFNLVFALTAGATSLIYLDQADRLLELCDEAANVATEEALGPFSEHVNIMQWRGAAHIQRGEFAVGHPLAKQGNDFWTMAGGRICTAMFRGWIVLGLQGLGRIDEASALNADNIAHCRNTGDIYMEPECIRLRGELALQGGNPDLATAEASYREAIAIAQTHGARSWELRAAMSLARLFHSRDRRADAVACLEPVLSRFTEGLETEDLRQAGSLLAELA
jgi:class 3 adenylate cyclase/predicted ATPase